MTRTWLLMPLAWLSGCGSVECGIGFVPGADGACLPAFVYADACADGQLRDGTGACRAPEGFEVDEGEPDIETEDPEETDGGEETGRETEEPEDTGREIEEPSELTCTYEVAFFTGSYASECAWQIYSNDDSVLNYSYGSFGTNNITFEAEFTVIDNESYTVDMFDSYADSWNGAYLTVFNVTGDVAAEGTVAGSSNTISFVADCPPPRR